MRQFDTEVELAAEDIAPQVTWGTSPEMVAAVTASVPTLDAQPTEEKRKGLGARSGVYGS